MVKRILAALAVALAAPLALAATADVQIASMTVSKSSVVTGERLFVTLRWRNAGPDAAHSVVATLSSANRAFVLTAAGTSNWPCEPSSGAGGFECRGARLDPGAQAEMIVSMLAPAWPDSGSFALTAAVTADEQDPVSSNNSSRADVDLSSAATRADLTLSPAEQRHRATPGSIVTIPLIAANRGPDDAVNVKAFLAFDPGTRIPVTAAGSGWTCSNATHSAWIAECQRERIPAGGNAPLTVTATMPDTPGAYRFAARLASEGQANGESPATGIAIVETGQEAPPPSTTRILVPLTGGDVPGANGALWRTEITAIVNADAQITTVHVPLRTPFDPRTPGLIDSSHATGAILAVASENAPRLQVDSRVYDVSRRTETAGSEIPIVPESRFTSARSSILAIPAGASYRQTLRVYELDGVAARVAIRVYADAEATPRLSLVQPLAPGLAPSIPGYLQIDLGQLLNASGIEKLRVDVEPVDPGVRLWAFVSVTNNDTHHVTTFSAW